MKIIFTSDLLEYAIELLLKEFGFIPKKSAKVLMEWHSIDYDELTCFENRVKEKLGLIPGRN